MSLTSKFIRIGWIFITVAMEYASTIGGDASILWGWVLLVWTAPFSMILQFYLYDFALQYMTRSVAQLVVAGLEVVCTYLFWFVLIPKIVAKLTKLVNSQRIDTKK